MSRSVGPVVLEDRAAVLRFLEAHLFDGEVILADLDDRLVLSRHQAPEPEQHRRLDPLKTGACLRALDNGAGLVRGERAFSADGRWMVSASGESSM